MSHHKVSLNPCGIICNLMSYSVQLYLKKLTTAITAQLVVNMLKDSGAQYSEQRENVFVDSQPTQQIDRFGMEKASFANLLRLRLRQE